MGRLLFDGHAARPARPAGLRDRQRLARCPDDVATRIGSARHRDQLGPVVGRRDEPRTDLQRARPDHSRRRHRGAADRWSAGRSTGWVSDGCGSTARSRPPRSSANSTTSKGSSTSSTPSTRRAPTGRATTRIGRKPPLRTGRRCPPRTGSANCRPGCRPSWAASCGCRPRRSTSTRRSRSWAWTR